METNKPPMLPDYRHVVGGRLGGAKTGAKNRAKTHCVRGHEFTEANTRRYGTQRHCRACAQIRDAKRQAKG